MRRLVVSVAFPTSIAPSRMRAIPTRLAHIPRRLRRCQGGADLRIAVMAVARAGPQDAFDEQADDAGVDEGIVGATCYGGAIAAVRNWAGSVFATQAIHQRWKRRRRTVCGLSTSTRRQRRRRGHRQD